MSKRSKIIIIANGTRTVLGVMEIFWNQTTADDCITLNSLNVIELYTSGFPCGSAGKESACNVGDLGSITGLGRSPGERNGYPLQYSGLENSMDYIAYGVAKSRTTEWLSLHFTSLQWGNLVVWRQHKFQNVCVDKGTKQNPKKKANYGKNVNMYDTGLISFVQSITKPTQ